MQTYRHNAKAQRCNVGNSRGFCIIGDLNIPCAQILCSQQCSAGRIGDGIGSACSCIEHTDTGSKYQSLCHGTEGSLQSVTAIFRGNRQIVTSEVEIAAAGLLRRIKGHSTCDVQIASAVHLCFLNILQVCNSHGNLYIRTACRCAGKNCIGSCQANCTDGQRTSSQAAGRITGNQCSVIAGISGNADVQCRCH